MPQNLELKAHYPDLKKGIAIAHSIKAEQQGIFTQEDRYYRVASGRLKLRIINKKNCELIHYFRPNTKSGRYSEYAILQLTHPEKAKIFFSQLYTTDVVVKKRRVLYLWHGVRLHFDTVEGLGTFIEFEVPVKSSRKRAEDTLNKLIRIFSIDKNLLVAHSYSDLLRKNR